MHSHPPLRHKRRFTLASVFLAIIAVVLVACGSGNSNNSSNSSGHQLASNQVLTFPNVGTQDIGVLDPAQGPDGNSAQVVNMIYSGLVRSDKNLNVIPDQATWTISSDNKVYTFHLKKGIAFSDGTPVTTQDYVYTLTRALLPEVKSPVASFFEGPIVGSDAVASGKTKTLSGVKALDDQTLQVTLSQPTPYFLEAATNSLYYPLNHKLIDQYGQTAWTQHVPGAGAGTGPFMVKEWVHNTRMVMVPNPHYYGAKTNLKEVDMPFVVSPDTAFRSYRAGQYSFVWNITANNRDLARTLPGFTSQPILQTDLLFFSNKMAPFNNLAVRQAFAYATNKDILARDIFKDAVTPAPTIIPPGMPGYQPNYPGLAYDAAKAKSLFQSVYPNPQKVPTITFAYPTGQVSTLEAAALQQMWQQAIGIQVKLRSVDLNAYNDETAKHEVQFGFTQWGADFPDPYDWLALNLTSTASNNNGDWHNTQFDQLVSQAEKTSGDARIKLYNQAEQIAIENVGWLPLDHQTITAVIPPYVQGVQLNGNGLYFGDWSTVSLLQH